MHLILFVALLQAAAQPSESLEIVVLDPMGAVVVNADVSLVPNRCSQYCEREMSGQRLEARTRPDGLAVFHPQPGVIYDMVVLKCGLAPLAQTESVMANERSRVTVTMQAGQEPVVVEVCSDCPMIQVWSPLDQDLTAMRIPLAPVPSFCPG